MVWFLSQGDAGGPVVNVANKTLLGVVAYSPIGCGLESKGFGIYTNVVSYGSFIEKALADVPDYNALSLQLPSSPS